MLFMLQEIIILPAVASQRGGLCSIPGQSYLVSVLHEVALTHVYHRVHILSIAIYSQDHIVQS